MSLDLTKPVMTRDGRKATILCTDLKNNSPVVARVESKEMDGSEVLLSYAPTGKFHTMDSGYDLINVPQKHSRWLNVSMDGDGELFFSTYSDHKLAEHAWKGSNGRIACIKVEFTEGEGL